MKFTEKASRYSSAKSPKNLQLGQTVYITTLDQKGQVRILDQDGNVLIQVGIMKVNANISDLRLVKEETRKSRNRKKVKPRSVSISPSSLRAEYWEAMVQANLYLDNTFLAEIKFAIISKGTGYLEAPFISF